MSNDYSFYTSLHAYTNDNKYKHHKHNSILNYVPQNTDKIQETEESSIDNEAHETEGLANPTTDPVSYKLFLETIKQNYANCGLNLQIALEKFAERYNAAKAKLIPVLMIFLYDINWNVDLLACVKSSTKI
ncbi:44630_t:CDS:2 [Gigaspora margarita]|uniref:44630_t:CDS:1 n=1 Tax=Gigaspora margarita TaxID=4874 RepID=A0ABN7VCF1_GIGMA|nr:44630_t:CDS:2 [Gigaspora margarita]